ncbi:hypothetical protein [Geoalkalibacter subterraneus]|uniref:hypothetical protein n=1 Tax=Geoalkalibacter subterraneus TaxID=483547 RepID=UPI000693B2D3|nr:hypothetical protein [Geoalkalibacter subterraneus]
MRDHFNPHGFCRLPTGQEVQLKSEPKQQTMGKTRNQQEKKNGGIGVMIAHAAQIKAITAEK